MRFSKNKKRDKRVNTIQYKLEDGMEVVEKKSGRKVQMHTYYYYCCCSLHRTNSSSNQYQYIFTLMMQHKHHTRHDIIYSIGNKRYSNNKAKKYRCNSFIECLNIFWDKRFEENVNVLAKVHKQIDKWRCTYQKPQMERCWRMISNTNVHIKKLTENNNEWQSRANKIHTAAKAW